MNIIPVSSSDYDEIFKEPLVSFGKVGFTKLNTHKCGSVHYLTFCDARGKIRLGMIAGEYDGIWKVPFSAPFGCLESRGEQRLDYYIESVLALRDFLREHNLTMCVTLPPAIYDHKSIISKQFNAFLTVGAKVKYADYNYHYDLTGSYQPAERMWASARRNLSAAMRSDFEFVCHETPDRMIINEVYKVIYLNHTGLGYPVHMSCDDIEATCRVIDMDFFSLKLGGITVASAIIYHTSAECAQLIYWGDLAEYRHLRPMNLLAVNIIDYYHDTGKMYFDLGPASSDGVPALGLCDFKESLGCHLTSKFTLEL